MQAFWAHALPICRCNVRHGRHVDGFLNRCDIGFRGHAGIIAYRTVGDVPKVPNSRGRTSLEGRDLLRTYPPEISGTRGSLMIAGFPTAVAPDGTSCVTTAPAPIRALSPITTRPMIFAPTPM